MTIAEGAGELTRGSAQKEWCRPILRKLPIAATAASGTKGTSSADMMHGTKSPADGGSIS
jgi:hypothetical protein